MKEKENLSGIINIFSSLRSNIDELLRTDISKMDGRHPEFDFNSKITAPLNALRREIASKQSWAGDDYFCQICDYCEKLLKWVKEYRYNPIGSTYAPVSSSVEVILRVIYEQGRRTATQATPSGRQDTSQFQQRFKLGETMAAADAQVRKELKSSFAANRIMITFGMRI
jgi:hypothetical protein